MLIHRQVESIMPMLNGMPRLRQRLESIANQRLAALTQSATRACADSMNWRRCHHVEAQTARTRWARPRAAEANPPAYSSSLTIRELALRALLSHLEAGLIRLGLSACPPPIAA